MSSLDALSTASASLLATQQQISVVAQNVGNAQSANYVQRVATSVPVSTGTDGATKVVVQRAVNTALQNALLTSTSNSGAAGYTSNVYQQLENLTGSSSGTPELTSSVQGLISAFQAYQTTPESQSAQSGVIAAASSIVQSIQNISGGITAIQTQTQNDLTGNVSSLNTALVQVQQLNRNITQLQSNGSDASNLEDQRDAVIAQIAKLVPVKQQQNSDGSVSLFTPSGVSLVGTTAASFSYDASTNTLYASDDANKTALNGSITSGTIGAGLNILRTDSAAVQSTDPDDAPLEKVRQQLNAFADLLYSAPPAAATALQSAYDSASPSNAGELSSSLFTFSTTPPAGSNDDRDYIAVNPALLNGTATVKQSAAEPVLAALTGSTVNFSGGNLSLSTSSFTQVAEAIASDQSARSSAATSNSDSASTNLSTATQAYSNQTGVSVDQQLSKLVVLQNAYNASAKIISTINTLQQALFNAVS